MIGSFPNSFSARTPERFHGFSGSGVLIEDF